jgi:hypothetical protein
MLNIRLSNGRFTKFMGVLPTFSLRRGNNDVELCFQRNFTSLAEVPFLNVSYFNNNQRDLRMGSTLSSSIEYHKMVLTNGCVRRNITTYDHILNMSYIDFPNNQRLFNVYSRCDSRIEHSYFMMNKITLDGSSARLFYRILVYNQSYNDNSDWKTASQRLADYVFLYG